MNLPPFLQASMSASFTELKKQNNINKKQTQKIKTEQNKR